MSTGPEKDKRPQEGQADDAPPELTADELDKAIKKIIEDAKRDFGYTDEDLAPRAEDDDFATLDAPRVDVERVRRYDARRGPSGGRAAKNTSRSRGGYERRTVRGRAEPL